MGDGEETRLAAWHQEMRATHARLREALEVVRSAVAAGAPVPSVESGLLLYCHGFCAALGGHHEAEDGALFPALATRRPDLAPVLAKLRQDHSMISHLLHALRDATDREAPAPELTSHLDGIGAIMESHFRYEERELLPVLATVRLDLEPPAALGPF